MAPDNVVSVPSREEAMIIVVINNNDGDPSRRIWIKGRMLALR